VIARPGKTSRARPETVKAEEDAAKSTERLPDRAQEHTGCPPAVAAPTPLKARSTP